MNSFVYNHHGFVANYALVHMMYGYGLTSWLNIYYTHLTFVKFEHSVCRGSLTITCIMLRTYLAEQSLLLWY